jgi:hypothetical protein
MQAKIKEYLKGHNIKYAKIKTDISANKIYDLLLNNIIYESKINIEIYYLAIYYKINNKYDLMKQTYLICILDNNDNRSIRDLSKYYIDIEKNPTVMRYYLLRGVVNEDKKSMCQLGVYYQNINRPLFIFW